MPGINDSVAVAECSLSLNQNFRSSLLCPIKLFDGFQPDDDICSRHLIQLDDSIVLFSASEEYIDGTQPLVHLCFLYDFDVEGDIKLKPAIVQERFKASLIEFAFKTSPQLFGESIHVLDYSLDGFSIHLFLEPPSWWFNERN